MTPSERSNPSNPPAPPRRPVRGMTYKIIGVGMLIFALLLLATLNTDNPPAPEGVLLLLVAGLLVWGGILARRGKRYGAVQAEELLARDQRPPILYLRSFADEVKDTEVPNVLRAMGRAIFARRISDQAAPYGPAEQDELANMMKKIGPYIAIGRPGEPMPELGAARMYVPDHLWRKKVSALMKRSKFVLVRAGRTQGLRWEMEHLVKHLEPTQLLVILPLEREAYKQFCQWVNRVLPKKLPAKAPKERLLMFDENWNPVPLKSQPSLIQTFTPFFLQNDIKPMTLY